MQIWLYYSLALKLWKIPHCSKDKKQTYIPSKDLKCTVFSGSFIPSLPYFPPCPTTHSTIQPDWIYLFKKKTSIHLLHLLQHANWSSTFLTIFAISCTLFSQIILTQFFDFLLEFLQEASHPSFSLGDVSRWCAPGTLFLPLLLNLAIICFQWLIVPTGR